MKNRNGNQVVLIALGNPASRTLRRNRIRRKVGAHNRDSGRVNNSMNDRGIKYKLVVIEKMSFLITTSVKNSKSVLQRALSIRVTLFHAI